MTFKIRIDPVAKQEIDGFAAYAAEYSDTWAMEQFARLDHVFSIELAESPLRRSFFVLTGAPYRAYLFRVAQHTHYWIIYVVDEDNSTVNVLRFWNASRDPAEFRPVDKDEP